MKPGAYYFDGWTGRTNHIRIRLTDEFEERQPVWGWVTSTPRIMRRQIDCAADAGFRFFSFCWYNRMAEDPDARAMTPHLNHGLDLFLEAPNRERLEFCLLVAGHGRLRILPDHWEDCCEQWIPLLRHPGALKADGRPLIIFFSPGDLQDAFGDAAAVKDAFEFLRRKARDADIGEIAVAGCVKQVGNHSRFVDSGYDCLTGYNYAAAGYVSDGKAQRFDGLVAAHRPVWDNLAAGPLPCIPLVTTGWDRRPWEAHDLPEEEVRPYYPDRSTDGITEMSRQAARWLEENPERTFADKLLLFYAWNENGEGGYLTPTEDEGDTWLKAVFDGLRKHA